MMNQFELEHVFDMGMLVDAEILDNLKKFEDGYTIYDSFDEFSAAFVRRIQGYPRRKSNIAITVGAPAWGKSESMDQWMVRTLTQLTDQLTIEVKGEEIIVDNDAAIFYRLRHVDAVKAAQELGVVPRLEYGQWTPDHLDKITQLAERAIDIAREGAVGIRGIENNYIGLIGIDSPIVTASKTKLNTLKGEEYTGHNRMYTLLENLLLGKSENAKYSVAPNVFVLALLTDAQSQHRRLNARAALPANADTNQLQQWFEASGMVVSEENLGAVTSSDYVQSFATLNAATEICKQMDDLLLKLGGEGEILLSADERCLLEQEIDLINQGKKLTAPEIYVLQDRRAMIVGKKLYPHILRSLGLRARQSLVAWNLDVPRVHSYPLLPYENNLIMKIREVNEKLLIP